MSTSAGQIIFDELHDSFQQMLEEVVSDLKEVLKAQGHVLTGRLLESIRFEIQVTSSGISGKIYMLDYGVYVDRGVSQQNIPFRFGSGARTSKYIQALIGFFKKKGLSDKRAKGAAFATARIHKTEPPGMPTKKSARFSSTGERTGFLSKTMERKQKYYFSILRDRTSNRLQVSLTNYFTQAIQRA